MDPEKQLIIEQLDLLLKSQTDKSEAFLNAKERIENEYDRAVKVLEDKDASAAEKKQAKDVTDAITKGLPNLTKAALSAASAFKSGDYINGSAAIMEICAAGAQMIGSLSAAAGPFGAVFGAVFSIVGQLLTYFGPKQPSLTSQIEDIINRHDAKKTLQFAEADGDVVDEYTKTIYRIASSLPRRLKNPLPKDSEGLRDFHIDLGKDYEEIKASYSKVSVLYNKWVTARWLMDKSNQELEKWPEVLGIFCRVYSDSLLANLALASMVDRQSVDQRFAETTKRGNPNYDEHKEVLRKINALLDKLLIKVSALPELWEEGNEKMQQFLERIRPVAQDRGLFVHLGTDKYLYAATGRKAIESDSWKSLSIGYGGRGHRFSLTVPKEEVGSLTPQYHIFFCEHWHAGGGDLEHGRVTPSPVGIFDQRPISDEKFSDVWALPAPKNQKRAAFVYVATDDQTSGSVKGFELDEKNQFKHGNWSPGTKSGVVNVRAVTHPPAPLPNDPDKDALPPGSSLLGGGDHYNPIIYGGLRSSSEIYVNHSNTGGYVPTPWGDYIGIEVDPFYIWVFRQHGLACATHASVISCLQGKRKMPRWMEHGPADALGDQSRDGEGNDWLVDGRRVKSRPPLKGLISLSPCIDGTMYASIYNRTVSRSTPEGRWLFEAKDTLGSYTTRYNIDLKAGRLNAGPWVKCGGKALQVQKMPIPSWSLFESLEKTLKEKLVKLRLPEAKPAKQMVG
jgi:hypothetical protein